jgi:hypothetical protein
VDHLFRGHFEKPHDDLISSSACVIYQIYSEATGAGQDVLCMHRRRMTQLGWSLQDRRGRARSTIWRQDRDEPATNILAANQLGRC